MCYYHDMATYVLHFDGSCWPNPGGTAAFGYTLETEGEKGYVREESGVIGTSPAMSNNVAEFFAANAGVEDYMRLPALKSDVLKVYGDSDLVVKMMNGVYRPSSDKLYYPHFCALNGNVRRLRELGVQVSFTWIRRDKNTRCDDLSKAHNK